MVERKSSQRGQVFLAFVFFIGGIIAVVGLLIAFFAMSSSDTSYGISASFTAESVATAGAEDALLKLDRNAAFSSTGYTVSSGSSTAAVVVTNPSSANQATILSTAVVSSHTNIRKRSR
jgi:uncharacterized protein (UPF0333 family)